MPAGGPRDFAHWKADLHQRGFGGRAGRELRACPTPPSIVRKDRSVIATDFTGEGLGIICAWMMRSCPC
jgi:hypothetical protein